MSSSSFDNQISDLLIARAIRGLSPGEKTSLETWQSDFEIEEDRSFDYTIAIIDAAIASKDVQELPVPVSSRVARDAHRYMNPRLPTALLNDRDAIVPQRTNRIRPRETCAWLAFAASLMLATFLWLSRPDVPRQLTIAQLEAVPDLKRIELKPTDDLSAKSLESAEVLWSDSLQQGFARYRGLAVNDPTVEQYQLWVIDRERGFQQRVDGGVFNVSSNSAEIVIPIHAKLNVSDAKGFAVTREPPGGVVVSDLKRVALISEKAAE